MSSNEIRQVVGLPPVDDQRADELRNKNLNADSEAPEAPVATENTEEEVTGNGTV